jgi:hypothetical protein
MILMCVLLKWMLDVFRMATLLGGCVFKNNSGDISKVVCKKETIVTDPCMAEALGVRWCLQLACDQGLQKLEIQTDALVVADCISAKPGTNLFEYYDH